VAKEDEKKGEAMAPEDGFQGMGSDHHQTPASASEDAARADEDWRRAEEEWKKAEEKWKAAQRARGEKT